VRTSSPAVEVDELCVDRGPVRAVEGASFVAPSAAVTVLLGPNGAGKTSTVEHLEGYLPRSAGTSRVLGLDPERDHRRLSARVGVMLQSGGIPTGIRPHELLAQYASFFDDPMEPAGLLDQVGLTERARTPWRRLSGGERQRLSLALALVGRPELAFLDEPTAAVDLDGRDLIRSLVRSLADDGTTVVLTTHDLAEAEQLADHVVIIDHGRVVAEGTTAELAGAADTDDLRFGAAAGLDTEAISAAVGGPVREPSPGSYVVGLPPEPEVVAAVTSWLADHGVALTELRAGRASLEDVFRRLTSGDERVDAGPVGPDDDDRPSGPTSPPGGRPAGRRGRR
jgi:ABC-2 type transport system ATP-binding protein